MQSTNFTIHVCRAAKFDCNNAIHKVGCKIYGLRSVDYLCILKDLDD